MITFRINKNSKLYDVLVACMKIAKKSKQRRKIESLQGVYYNSVRKEIVATNGTQLLVYKIDLAEECHVGQNIKNSNLTLMGDIVLVEERENGYVDYERTLKILSVTKTLIVDNCFPSGCKQWAYASMQIARPGVIVSSDVMDVYDLIGFYLHMVDIPNPNEVAVRFYSDNNALQFVVCPFVSDSWKVEKAKENSSKNL